MTKKIIGSVVLLGCTLILTLQFPSLFIPQQLEYESFKIYANEEIPLNKNVKQILDSVRVNLEASHFYRKDQILELYFVQGTWYENFIGWFGTRNIASSKFDKHIYIGKPDFEKGVLRKSEHEFEWLNLVQIISHEGVHSQMYRDYSTLGFMQTPSWMNEGYSEYISYQPMRARTNHSLLDLFQKYKSMESDWVKTEYGSMTPKFYLRDRILMEYLIDEKQMDIKMIIEDKSLEPQKILDELESFF